MNKYVTEDNSLFIKNPIISPERMRYVSFFEEEDTTQSQEQINEGNRFKSFYINPILYKSCDYQDKVKSEISSVEISKGTILPVKKIDKELLLSNTQERYLEPRYINKDASSVFIKTGNKLVKVLMDSILFMYTDSKNYCSLITVDDKKLSVRSSIQGLYKLLNKDTFVQSHRSYLINWKRVDAIFESDQTLEINGHHIPIGRTYKKNVYAKLNII